MTSHERARRLCVKAERMGLDAPNERMIAEAIHDAEADTFNDYLSHMPQEWRDRIEQIKESVVNIRIMEQDL
jgi:hypothetical protein